MIRHFTQEQRRQRQTGSPLTQPTRFQHGVQSHTTAQSAALQAMLRVPSSALSPSGDGGGLVRRCQDLREKGCLWSRGAGHGGRRWGGSQDGGRQEDEQEQRDTELDIHLFPPSGAWKMRHSSKYSLREGWREGATQRSAQSRLTEGGDEGRVGVRRSSRTRLARHGRAAPETSWFLRTLVRILPGICPHRSDTLLFLPGSGFGADFLSDLSEALSLDLQRQVLPAATSTSFSNVPCGTATSPSGTVEVLLADPPANGVAEPPEDRSPVTVAKAW